VPARRAQRCALPGISGGKLPSVYPCPKILALQRAIFRTASQAPEVSPMANSSHVSSVVLAIFVVRFQK
jgi:hypothetical protein